MPEQSCATCPQTRYCAPNRCYCGHDECPATYVENAPRMILRRKDGSVWPDPSEREGTYPTTTVNPRPGVQP